MVAASRLSLVAAASMVASAAGQGTTCALTEMEPKEVRHAVGVARCALQRSRGWVGGLGSRGWRDARLSGQQSRLQGRTLRQPHI